MRVFKTKWFHRWAVKEGLSDIALMSAVREMESGLVDAQLGRSVVKKRVALPGRRKSSSTRTLLAYHSGAKAFFVYGFTKNERANIGDNELKALKLLATELLGYRPATLRKAIKAGELVEVVEIQNHD